jgi:hypothetical protein
MRDIKPFNATEFIVDTGFQGEHAKIIRRYGLLVLDNNGFDGDQIRVINNLLDKIPVNLHKTTSISQHELLGNTIDSTVWMDFYGSFGVNIFKSKLNILENQSPTDIDSILVPIFNAALQHEINHIVDAFYVDGNPVMKNRKAELIARAGTVTEQYLRSAPSRFFVDAPQEFFASISNLYLSNSFHTLKLGLQRFDEGWKEPINQFLFFADVYSVGGNTIPFYTLNTMGAYARVDIPITRGSNNSINSLTFNSKKYQFDLDSNGNVLSYTDEQFVSAETITGSISASPNPCSIPGGQTLCSTTVSWTTSGWTTTPGPGTDVYVTNSITNQKQLFAQSGATGSSTAPWIQANTQYTFELFAKGNKISQVIVTGSGAGATTHTLTVTKGGTGTGLVTGSGIHCGSDCSESYTSGTIVALSATPSTSAVFAGWSGACAGAGTTCAVSMTADKTATATFNSASPVQPSISPTAQ